MCLQAHVLTSLIEIIPAILTDSPERFKELIKKLESYTDRIHLDIADGDFVPNKTVKGYEELRQVGLAIKFDVHLMVKRPQDQIKEWFDTQVERFIIHVESDVNLDEIIKDIKKHNRKIGLTLNPETPIEKIEPYLQTSRSLASGPRSKASGSGTLYEIDFVQFMTIHPGFQGQPFLDEIVDKISLFHTKYPDIIIMCDGGVTPETGPKLVKVGASVLVAGSYIVKNEDVGKAIEYLRKSIKE